ncbi:MAG TPA: HyaD/HybD family hydrogenase maturation endopeptidase [Thermoanaerobaculia bacterium]|nr:HyaD/HybD family hydrogenase maturation endopeptidase [Thermoanaerobaculia bacterium]
MSGISSAVRPVRLLILGLGNVLCGDDGLGAAAVLRLQERYVFPEGVTVLDGGTLGLSLLPYIEDAERVILVDAIRAEGPAGSFVRLSGDDVGPAVASRLSVHQVGVVDLLDAARWTGRLPDELVLLGLVPQTLELSVVLSPALEASLPDLVERVAEEAQRLGFAPLPRTAPRPVGTHATSVPRSPLACGVSGL